jgi:hypothetical protein
LLLATALIIGGALLGSNTTSEPNAKNS